MQTRQQGEQCSSADGGRTVAFAVEARRRSTEQDMLSGWRMKRASEIDFDETEPENEKARVNFSLSMVSLLDEREVTVEGNKEREDPEAAKTVQRRRVHSQIPKVHKAEADRFLSSATKPMRESS